MSSSSPSSFKSNTQTELTTKWKQPSNVTSYDLSNFAVNSVNQQNFDILYVGKIDVVKKVLSNNPKIPDVTNSFKDVGVSIYILNNSTLFINFDKQTVLFKEFKDIPLVGFVQ